MDATTTPIRDHPLTLHTLLWTDTRRTLKAVKELLRTGTADTLARNDAGQTPLETALFHARRDVARVLVLHIELLRALTKHLGHEPTRDELPSLLQGKTMRKFRKDSRRRAGYHSDKLLDAARKGDLLTVRSMVHDDVVTVNTVDKTSGETPFSVALGHGQWHVCAFLMDHTDAYLYNPCVVGRNLQSVLLTVVLAGRIDIVRRLDPHWAVESSRQFDNQVAGPLVEAVASGSAEMVDALLTMGVRPNQYTCHFNVPPPASYALWFYHRDLTPAQEETQTLYWVLARACWHQHERLIMHLLMTYDAFQDPEGMASGGAAALFLAVFHQNEPLVRELLARGVDVNTGIALHMTAAVAAVLTSSLDMLTLLLDHGADASVVHSAIKGSTGNFEGLLATALHCGAIECAHVLLPMRRGPSTKATRSCRH